MTESESEDCSKVMDFMSSYINNNPQQFPTDDIQRLLTEPKLCYSGSYDWYVKIQDNYNNIQYINEYRYNKEELIKSGGIRRIFDAVVLPDDYVDDNGNLHHWYIADYEHLYDIQPLPHQYMHTNENPECFVKYCEQESWIDREEDFEGWDVEVKEQVRCYPTYNTDYDKCI